MSAGAKVKSLKSLTEGPVMDQPAPYLCQHGHLNGLGPQCYSRCRQAAERAAAPKLEVTLPKREVTASAPTADPHESRSRVSKAKPLTVSKTE